MTGLEESAMADPIFCREQKSGDKELRIKNVKEVEEDEDGSVAIGFEGCGKGSLRN